MSQLQPCSVKVSTIFVLDSPVAQTAANTVYVAVSTFNNRAGNVASGTKYQFKTDYERMQYLIGLYGRASQGLR